MSIPRTKTKTTKLPKTVAAVKKAEAELKEAPAADQPQAQGPETYSFKDEQGNTFLVVSPAGISVGGAPTIGVGSAVYTAVQSLLRGQTESYKKGYQDGAGAAFVKLQGL